MTLADEIRGLFAQVSATRLPAAADLHAYLAPRARAITVAGPNLEHPAWAKQVSGAQDVYVELGDGDVTGIHLFDDSRGWGAYATLYVRRGALADVEAVTGALQPVPRRAFGAEQAAAYPEVAGHRVRVFADHDAGKVSLVMVHFERISRLDLGSRP
jgi:hypothetical protein